MENIAYEGNVTITLQSDKKVVVKKRAHNKGATNLFKFIALCLSGNSASAESLQPTKIKLFYNNYSQGIGSTNMEKAIYNVENWTTSPNNIETACKFVYINTAGTIESVTDTNKFKAILHFRVPVSYINDNTTYINQICLYATSETAETQYSAYFIIPSDTEGEVGDIDISSLGKTYTMIVEWELIIGNQN